MYNLNDMDRDERSLLLYFETCAVDYNGRINQRRMNEVDRTNAERWNESGFIRNGRIIVADHNNDGTHWVELSEDAWNLAHAERRARQARSRRHYTRTCDA